MSKKKHNLELIITLSCLCILGVETLYLTAAAQEIQYGHIDFTENNQSNNFDNSSDEHQGIQGVAIYGCHFGCDKIHRFAREGVQIGSDSGNGYLNLENGNVLLNPEKDLVVGISLGKIHIASGATIFVMKSDDNVVVYDLLQTKPKQVSIAVPTIINKPPIVLEPGCMLVLTSQNTQNFEELEVNSHAVTYKNAQLLDSYSGVGNAFIANFSIVSALNIIQPLKRLIISDNRMDKLALDRLVKSAAIMGDFADAPESEKIVLAQLKTNHSLQASEKDSQQ